MKVYYFINKYVNLNDISESKLIQSHSSDYIIVGNRFIKNRHGERCYISSNNIIDMIENFDGCVYIENYDNSPFFLKRWVRELEDEDKQEQIK